MLSYVCVLMMYFFLLFERLFYDDEDIDDNQFSINEISVDFSKNEISKEFSKSEISKELDDIDVELSMFVVYVC